MQKYMSLTHTDMNVSLQVFVLKISSGKKNSVVTQSDNARI